MGFAILRHGKIKSTGKGVSVAHNHRTATSEQPNIDRKLSGLNSYMEGSALDRINAKLPPKHRKDAVVAVEILLTASPEFFDKLATDRGALAKHQVFKKWVADSFAWAQREFGSNLVDAALHMDESSPHIHLLAVPLVQGRLCAKEVMGRKEMQRRQTEYAKAVESHGLNRGATAAQTKRKHIPLKDNPPAAGGQAQGELVKLQEKLARSQAAVKQQQALNLKNFHLINALESELKQVKAENQALISQKSKPPVERTEKPVEPRKGAQATFPHPATEKAPEKPSMAPEKVLPDAWKGLPEVDAKQVEAGTVQEVVGDKARYHMGRGRYVIGPAPDPVREQEKGRSGPSVGR